MKFTYFAISAASIVCAAAQEECLTACAGKVGVELSNCQASCLGNPHPSEEQVNQNAKCVAGCDEGDGTPAATEKYTKCIQDCMAKYFSMPTGTTEAQPSSGQPSSGQPSGSQPSASPTPGAQASPSPSGTGSGSGSGVGNGSSITTTSPTSNPE